MTIDLNPRLKTSILGYIREENPKYLLFNIQHLQQTSQHSEETGDVLDIQTDITLKIYTTWIYRFIDLKTKKKNLAKGAKIIYLDKHNHSKIFPKIEEKHLEYVRKNRSSRNQSNKLVEDHLESSEETKQEFDMDMEPVPYNFECGSCESEFETFDFDQHLCDDCLTEYRENNKF